MNRGGSWNNDARNCRSSYRNNNDPDNHNNNIGFRLCLSELRTYKGKSGYSNEASRKPVVILNVDDTFETDAII